MADKIERAKAVDFVRSGFDIRPTSNGGFLIRAPGLLEGYGRGINEWASFTDSADLLGWLAVGLAAYDKELADA